MRHLQAYRDILDRTLVVVQTTNSHERKAVLGVLKAHRKLLTKHPSHRAYLGVAANRVVLVLDGDGAFSGAGAASRFLCDFLANERYPTPAAVILCGVCWGNPALTAVGDVLVASTLTSVNRTVAEQSGETIVQPKTFETEFPEELVCTLKCADVVAPALMLSEEQLYKGTKARDELLKQYPNAHGGEMEGFVVAPTCENRSVPWLIIKSVSDFGGDDFERSTQAAVAMRSAEVFVKCLEHIPINEKYKEKLEELSTVICGHSFELRCELFDFGGNLALQVNDALRGLDTLINFYTGSAMQHERLGSSLAVVVKEIALNSLKHGGAKRIRIDVDPHGLSLNDDGKPYILEQLAAEGKGRGGQLAWRGFRRDYLEQGRLEISTIVRNKWRNSLRFNIENAHPHLPDMKEKCRAQVDALRRPAIHVHPECGDVYIDIRFIEMMSLALDTVEEFEPLLESGKRLFVALTDRDIRERIKAAFPGELESGALLILEEGSADIP
jgi:nucleoside phosphorylase